MKLEKKQNLLTMQEPVLFIYMLERTMELLLKIRNGLDYVLKKLKKDV